MKRCGRPFRNGNESGRAGLRPLLALLGALASFAALSCGDSSVNNVDPGARDRGRIADVDSAPTGDANPPLDHNAIIAFLTANFEPLPERQLAVSEDSTVYAQYAQPTTRYRHGILGDTVEAGQLVAWRDGIVCAHTLGEQYVFEDLRPRLFDVDGDGALELVAIRSHAARGAGIAIYKIAAGALVEWAWVEEIGTSSRWLNIAAIYDLDGDGAVELAWIQTPHIGGTLRVARIERGGLTVLDEASQYSNHAIGERNLCLSVVAQRVYIRHILTHEEYDRRTQTDTL